MPVNTDVMQIVRILEEEGFGALAGELLTEINLGRELDDDDGAKIHKSGASADDDSEVEALPRREPIQEDEQLGDAVRFLRLRLVEPVRRLAEAERIAAELSREQDQSGKQPQAPRKAIKIAFVDPLGDVATGFARTEQAGEEESANQIDDVLTRIARPVI